MDSILQLPIVESLKADDRGPSLEDYQLPAGYQDTTSVTYLNQEAGIMRIGLNTEHQGTIESLKRAAAGAIDSNQSQNISQKLRYTVTFEGLEVKVKLEESKINLHGKELEALQANVALMLSDMFSSSTREGGGLANFTDRELSVMVIAKAYKGSDRVPAKQDFHFHDEEIYVGILGLHSSGDYAGGELVIAKSPKHIFIDDVRTNYFDMAFGTGPTQDQILYKAKPNYGQAVFWPESGANQHYPDSIYNEHAVLEMVGERFVAVIAISENNK